MVKRCRTLLVTLILLFIYTSTATGILPGATSSNLHGLNALNIDRQTAIYVTTLLFSHVSLPPIPVALKSFLPIRPFSTQSGGIEYGFAQWDYTFKPELDFGHEIDMGFFGKVAAMENGMPLEVKAPWTANLERKVITLLKSQGHEFTPKLNLDIPFLNFLIACIEKSGLCIYDEDAHGNRKVFCPPDALGKYAIYFKKLILKRFASPTESGLDINFGITSVYDMSFLSQLANIDAYFFKPVIPCVLLSTHLYQGDIERVNKIIDIFLKKLLQGNQGNLKGYPRTTQGGLTGQTLEREAPKPPPPSNQEVNRAMRFLLSH